MRQEWCMRLTPRLGLRLILVAAAVAILCLRLIPRHHPRPAPPASIPASTSASIPDLALTSPLNLPGGAPPPPEAYEVYSALYQSPAQPLTDEPLAFAQNSITDIPQVGGSCLKPQTPAEHEMADAFVAANRQSHRWDPKFTIPQGYRLLDPTEVAQAQYCIATHSRDQVKCSSFEQLRHVRYLGVPGFDRAHTHALVSVIKNCGSNCGSGGIFAVEKTGARWQRSTPTDFTRDCSWIY
jgi:hypothetical protein